VTPSQALAETPPAPLEALVAGSWVNGTLATWIGSPAKNRAWTILGTARDALAGFVAAAPVLPPAEVLAGRADAGEPVVLALGEHVAMSPRGERGFTLIEVVLALSILAVMVTILFGSFRVGLRAWQRGEARAETLQHARSMTRFVEGALEGIAPYRARLDKDGPVLIAFKGERDRISFVSVSPPMPFQVPVAFTAITMSIAEGAEPGLAVREKAMPNYDPFEQVAPSLVDPTTSPALENVGIVTER